MSWPPAALPANLSGKAMKAPFVSSVGFLTDRYPGTETNALGWPQLFSDRAGMWLSRGGQAGPTNGHESPTRNDRRPPR